MTTPAKIFRRMGMLLCLGLLLGGPLHAHERETLRVVVVGDTGIGERAYHPGFIAVAEAMRKERADAILHLGDFVYQAQWFPKECPDHTINEIRRTLVAPYPVRIFVAGDNDLPPQKRKPKASGCWDKIAPMATPFDSLSGPTPPPLAGTMRLGNALFVVLNVYDWQDPSGWLSPIIKEARDAGRWVIFALHEPALTTAWYLEKRQTVLKQINALSPDLVFAGNQHAYERFHPMGIPRPDGSLPVTAKSVYAQGDGVTHIVAGGGGATFKPFADQQGNSQRTAPKTVFDALAKRSLMFHYLTLKISHDFLIVQTYRVCPAPATHDEKQNPRWHADDPMWENIALECDGQTPGTTLFDQIEIKK
ncbi:MAG: hypothetical protein E2O44_01255 [Nitrospina sp.]|nr:MAG: hypothetical protein E2O44_01255 [Nitrospina sp.]